jgi:adenine-specific DNA-methyltransferase
MSSSFVHQELLTCIGNKRKLAETIMEVVREVQARIGVERMSIVDACTGSGVVARYLLASAKVLYVNDLEYYAYLLSRGYLQRPTSEQQLALVEHFAAMQRLAAEGPYVAGIITQHYAPEDTQHVKEGERCFYTRKNALIIDTLRKYIEDSVPKDLQPYCLAPLLVKASIHANTSGVFKGFHKANGVGCFGGKGGDALGRILKPITVELPVWSTEPTTVHCSQLDVLELLKLLPSNIDLLYIDPPYNQHPYGSNYFMLNLIAQNKLPAKVSKVSGIPSDWTRSTFNYHASAVETMRTILQQAQGKVRYLLISYNNEGLITPEEWQQLLLPYKHEVREIEYDTYKGSRNLKDRSAIVTELLYLVQLP